MKAILKIGGKELEVEIIAEALKQLEDNSNKTGYERVSLGNKYYTDSMFYVEKFPEENEREDQEIYDLANYYSAESVAKNNARADKLMRQLRRFAVEHRAKPLYWPRDIGYYNYSILYNHDNQLLGIHQAGNVQQFGNIYFDTEETAHLAIGTFHDELMWYFTEYKDSL